MGKVVEPSVFNSKPVRVGVILATVALAFAQAAALPATAGLFVHLLAASVWLGVNVWVTFIAGPLPLTAFSLSPYPATPHSCTLAPHRRPLSSQARPSSAGRRLTFITGPPPADAARLPAAILAQPRASSVQRRPLP